MQLEPRVPAGLPAPDADSLAHSERVASFSQIPKTRGWREPHDERRTFPGVRIAENDLAQG